MRAYATGIEIIETHATILAGVSKFEIQPMPVGNTNVLSEQLGVHLANHLVLENDDLINQYWAHAVPSGWFTGVCL